MAGPALVARASTREHWGSHDEIVHDENINGGRTRPKPQGFVEGLGEYWPDLALTARDRYIPTPSEVGVGMRERLLGRRPDVRSIAVANIPTLIALAVCVAVTGVDFVNPTNIAWIRGDAAAGYLGWEFFRSTGWSMPLGLNLDYGLELGSSIVYSDSVPLLAIPFKLLAPLLPDTFQYFGIWILLCLIAMAHAAWRLLGLRITDPSPRALGTAFFVISPVMLWRLHPYILHVSLVAQFVVVMCIWLVLKPKTQSQWLMWTVLAAVATAIHAYFLPMVFLALTADLADRHRSGETNRDEVVRTVGMSIAAVAVTAWLTGYTAVDGSAGAWGFGIFRITPFALIDPDHDSYGSWSRLLPDIADIQGSHEGFGYLGLGMLALTIAACAVAIPRRNAIVREAKKHRLLLAALVLLTLFALSNVIGFGDHTVTVPLPSQLLNLASIFRSSARLFWLPYYAIVFAVIVIVFKGFGKCVGTVVLGVALLVQIADTSHGWQPIRDVLTTPAATQWTSELKDDFWERAASRYARVVAIAPESNPAHWQSLAQYAVDHGMGTDLVYIARFSMSRYAAIQELRLSELSTGNYRTDNLYIVREDYLPPVMQTLHRDTDMLARIDGIIVLAPGWKTCATCGGAAGEDLLAG